VRVACVADVHLANHRVHGGETVAGLNRRAEEIANALALAVQAAERAGCERFVVAGDLFDAASPSPQLVRRAQEALSASERPIKTFIIAGNHDIVSAKEGDNALGPLRALPHVEVVEVPRVVAAGSADLLLVPFQPGDARKWLPESVAALGLGAGNGKPRALVTHVGIVTGATPPYLRDAHDAVELEALQALSAQGISAVLAGNWHGFHAWGNICQIGALVPTGWDNFGMEGYGTLAIWDSKTGKLSREEIPGPRFLSISCDPEHVQPPPSRDAYVRWSVGPEDEEAACRARAEYLVESGRLRACEVVLDLGDGASAARSAARNAAERAQAASGAGLDEVLAAFVGAMQIPESVSREAVLSECRRFLAAG
jgi:hypothetical protein